MAKKKTSSKLRGGNAAKAWRMIQAGECYKDIADATGHLIQAIKLYARRKFKEEATKLWSEEIRAVGACEICNSTDNLNAHHLLEKSVWTHLRYDLSNGVCLCAGHHTMDRDCCPHGNLPAIEAFILWLFVNREGQSAWYTQHKHDQKYQDIDYEAAFWELK